MEDNCYSSDDFYGDTDLTQLSQITTLHHNVEEVSTTQGGFCLEKSLTYRLKDLMDIIMKHAGKLSEITCFALPASILLLYHCKWLLDVAKEKYFDNSENMLKTLKLTFEVATQNSTFLNNKSANECPLCTSYCEPNKALGLSSCSHFFCYKCWQDVVRHRLRSSEDIYNFRCPMDKCLQLLDITVLHNLFPAEEMDDIYLQLERKFLSNYVETSPRLTWCPNPKGCEGVIYTLLAFHPGESVRCTLCDMSFCFRCKEQPHSPASCEQMKNWLKLINTEFINNAYIYINTKGCPNCNMRIEKNYGCNHMTCKCRYEFCWVCLGNWNGHNREFFSCKNATLDDKSQSDGRDEKIRFLETNRNYIAQLDSSKKESAMMDDAIEKYIELARDQSALCGFYIAPDFLSHLLLGLKETLHAARQCIACAVVSSYYADDAQNDMHLFIFRKGELEKATEQLSLLATGFVTLLNVEIKTLKSEEQVVKQLISNLIE